MSGFLASRPPLRLLLCVFALIAISISTPNHGLYQRQAVPAPGQLDIFQVYQPVLTPSGTSTEHGCVYTKTLMEHNFAYSYGIPFVGR